MNWKKLGIALSLIGTAACGGGGGGGGGGGSAPANLVYPNNPAVYTVGFKTVPNVPTVTGTVDTWSVSPDLPAGITLDAVTGAIDGIPLVAVDPTDYTVTAANALGSTTAIVNVHVAVPAPRAAYVANLGDSTVLSYFVGSLIHSGYRISSGIGARAVAVSPHGRFVYLANNISGDVSIYSADPLSGRLVEVGTPLASGAQTSDIAVDPTSRFLYSSNAGDNTVSLFNINGTTGALTAGPVTGTGARPSALLVEPTGQFLYVTNSDSDDVEAFSLHPATGMLASQGVVAVGDQPQALATASVPGGQFLYVANFGSTDDISQFAIDPSDGSLTALVPPSVAAGTDPAALAVHPDGTFLYAANRGGDTISMYSIDGATGALMPLAPSTVATGDGPSSLAVDPSAGALYVCNLFSDEVYEYTIQPSGTLTLADRVRTRSNPSDIALGPAESALVMRSGFAYVTSAVPASNVSQYSIDTSSGVSFTPLAPAAVSTTGPGPRGSAMHPDQDFLVATSDSGFNISLFNRNPVTGVISVGGFQAADNTWDIAIDPSGRFVYATVWTLGNQPGIQPYVLDKALPNLTALTLAASGNDPRTLAIDPTGQFIYVADTAAGVHRFRITASNGELVSLGVTPGGGGTPSVLVHPSGRYVYASNVIGESISMYSITATTGALTPLVPASITTGPGSAPVGLATDLRGKHLYVTLSSLNQVSHFTIDPSTGLLTFESTQPTAADNPQDLAVDAGGKFLVCTNASSGGIISLFSIDPVTGAHTPAGFATANPGVGTTSVTLSTEFD